MRLARLLGLALLAAAVARPLSAGERGSPAVLVAPFSGVISPVAAEFLTGAVARANREGFDALVIELDTPGGLDVSMRAIVQAILASKTPVIVYVSPAGARAASAGAFITLSANLAAMAPGTNIGAAHPVTLPGLAGGGSAQKKPEGEDAVMQGKLLNDAVAYIRSIARERGRNEAWAVRAVTESASVPVADAVAEHVVDLEAPTLEDLLKEADGRRVPGLAAPLHVAGARVVYFEMSSRQRWLAALSDPNVAMILMSLGAAGLFIELYSPGLVFPGVVGAIALVLAFYSFQTLSASIAGILLILLGFLFFIVEVKFTSMGLLAVAGAASLLLGMMMLFQGQAGGLRVANSVIASTVGGMLGLTALASFLVIQAHRRRKESGAEGMIGRLAVALAALEPRGKVRVGGEVWDAVLEAGSAAAGEEVEISAVEGLTLKVKKRNG